MGDDGSAQSTSVWPLPKFYFQVKWDQEELSFQEVSGLDIEAQPIEYRHGNSKEFSTIKMPGIKKNGNITMKKGHLDIHLMSLKTRMCSKGHQNMLRIVEQVYLFIGLTKNFLHRATPLWMRWGPLQKRMKRHAM